MFSPQWSIITIYHLDYCTLDLRSNASANVPFVSDSRRGYTSVDAVLFNESSLLGTFSHPFNITNQVDHINMIYSICFSSSSYDMWIIPNPSEVESFGATMPLALVKLSYYVIQSTSTDANLRIPWDVEPN